MIKSAVTVSLVEQARKGPFVFHDDLPSACKIAAELGFDAIELFAPSGQAIRSLPLKSLLESHSLKLAAVGTGAGMVVHKLSLCDADPSRRHAAREFIKSIISAGADFGAPAIIGSMQGRWDDAVPQTQAVGYFRDALEELGEHAGRAGVVVHYEPLNRYESNMATTMAQGLELLKPLATNRIRILADLFHMNIEEASITEALQSCGQLLGHVHFVDSHRQAAGRGHLDLASVAKTLISMGFQGYASAEAFPIPDSITSARQTIESFRRLFRN